MTGPATNARTTLLRFTGGLGAVVGYGCFIAFLYLVCTQLYRWFRDGEWTHIGMSDGLRSSLARCCVKDLDNGRLASLLNWLDSPMDWLGLHRVFDVVPASLALFLVSVAGNCLFVYSRDRLQQSE